MKYILGFNENLNEKFYNEMKNYLEVELVDYFSYLKDNGFNIIINAYDEKSLFFFGSKNFYWSNISDDFVPLLITINKKFKIYSIKIIKAGEFGGNEIDFNTAINYDFNIDYLCGSILIYF